MPKKSVLKYTAALGLFLFAANLLAMVFYWYYSLSWFDLLTHFLGGAFVAGLVLYFLKKPTGFLAALAIIFAVGLGWEIFEAGADKFFGTEMQNMADSFGDLIADLVGGAAGLLYFKRNG